MYSLIKHVPNAPQTLVYSMEEMLFTVKFHSILINNSCLNQSSSYYELYDIGQLNSEHLLFFHLKNSYNNSFS